MSRYGAEINRYPLDYRAALAFSMLPYRNPVARLAARFPPSRSTHLTEGRTTGFTTFRVSARVG